MSRREMAILGLVAVGMVLLALLDPWSGVGTPSSQRLWNESQDSQLAGVRLQHEGQAYELRNGDGGGWQSVLPRAGAADENSLARLRASLRMLRVLRNEALSEKHGLGADASTLTLAGESGEAETLRFGVTTGDGRHRWMQRAGAKGAVLVEAYLVTDILASATSLRSKRLVPWALASHESLRVSRGQRWVELQGDEVRWSEADGNIMTAIADPLSRRDWLEALSAVHEDESPACVHPPELSIEQAGQRVVVSADLCLSPAPWARVLTGFQTPELLADMHLMPTRRPELDFTIACGDETREVHIAEVEQDALWQWWELLDAAPRRLVSKGRLVPACTLSGDGWQVIIGTREGSWVSASPHSNVDFALDEGVAALTQGISELFLSTLLIEEEGVFLRRIESQGHRALVLERSGPASIWRAHGGGFSEAQAAELAGRLAAVLGMLQAESFASSQSVPRRVEKRRILLEFDAALDEQSIHHEIHLAGGAETCTARVDDLPPARLAREDCAALWSY